MSSVNVMFIYQPALTADGNSYAAASFGDTTADLESLNFKPKVQDSTHVEHRWAMWTVPEARAAAANSAPTRPAWDVDSLIDMGIAQTVWEGALIVSEVEEDMTAYIPAAGLIIVLNAAGGAAPVLAAFGLSAIPSDDD